MAAASGTSSIYGTPWFLRSAESAAASSSSSSSSSSSVSAAAGTLFPTRSSILANLRVQPLSAEAIAAWDSTPFVSLGAKVPAAVQNAIFEFAGNCESLRRVCRASYQRLQGRSLCDLRSATEKLHHDKVGVGIKGRNLDDVSFFVCRNILNVPVSPFLMRDVMEFGHLLDCFDHFYGKNNPDPKIQTMRQQVTALILNLKSKHRILPLMTMDAAVVLIDLLGNPHINEARKKAIFVSLARKSNWSRDDAEKCFPWRQEDYDLVGAEEEFILFRNEIEFLIGPELPGATESETRLFQFMAAWHTWDKESILKYNYDCLRRPFECAQLTIGEKWGLSPFELRPFTGRVEASPAFPYRGNFQEYDSQEKEFSLVLELEYPPYMQVRRDIAYIRSAPELIRLCRKALKKTIKRCIPVATREAFKTQHFCARIGTGFFDNINGNLIPNYRGVAFLLEQYGFLTKDQVKALPSVLTAQAAVDYVYTGAAAKARQNPKWGKDEDLFRDPSKTWKIYKKVRHEIERLHEQSLQNGKAFPVLDERRRRAKIEYMHLRGRLEKADRGFARDYNNPDHRREPRMGSSTGSASSAAAPAASSIPAAVSSSPAAAASPRVFNPDDAWTQWADPKPAPYFWETKFDLSTQSKVVAKESLWMSEKHWGAHPDAPNFNHDMPLARIPASAMPGPEQLSVALSTLAAAHDSSDDDDNDEEVGSSPMINSSAKREVSEREEEMKHGETAELVTSPALFLDDEDSVDV